MIELYSGCIVLAEADRVAGIPIILRTMYEALVDLDNLLADPGYVENMESAASINIATSLSNPWLTHHFTV